MGSFRVPDDGLGGAFSAASRTTRAFCSIDGIIQKFRACTGGASSFEDMGFIFIPEIADGGQDRVGGSLTQAAQRTGFYRRAQLLEHFDIAFLPVPAGDVIQSLIHALDAFTTGRALAAGFEPGKVKEVAGDIDHAGALVHDDHTA